MEHGFLDKYADIASPVHRLDARVKLPVMIAGVFIAALTPAFSWLNIILLASIFIFMLIVSKVPLLTVFKRVALVLPVIIVLSLSYSMTAPSHRFELFFFYMIRAAVCLLSIIILVTTTRFDNLLLAMRYFKLPGLLTSMLSFFYRYIFVLQDELERMQRARSARLVKADRKTKLKAYYTIAGMLLLRSYERTERIYRSMIARGYRGQIHGSLPGHLDLPSTAFAVIFFLIYLILTINMVIT